MYGLDFPGCPSLEMIALGDGLKFVDPYSFENLSFYVGDTKIPASSTELSGRTFVKDDQGRLSPLEKLRITATEPIPLWS